MTNPFSAGLQIKVVPSQRPGADYTYSSSVKKPEFCGIFRDLPWLRRIGARQAPGELHRPLTHLSPDMDVALSTALGTAALDLSGRIAAIGGGCLIQVRPREALYTQSCRSELGIGKRVPWDPALPRVELAVLNEA